MRAQYEAQGVGFAALSLVGEREEVLPAVEKFGVKMKVLIAQDEVLGPFGVNQVPSTVFINKEGVIVAAASGPRGREFLERRLKELVR